MDEKKGEKTRDEIEIVSMGDQLRNILKMHHSDIELDYFARHEELTWYNS